MDGDYPLACGKMYSQIYTGYNFIKPKTAAQFGVSSMVSNTDIVAYDYLKNVFFNKLGVNVKACLDEDMLCPKSYCSFGYFNNVLSLKILCDKKKHILSF
ncbi:MAG: hypothetical protein SPL52_06050 [Fibrobacter sp.]|nr:hypothetical protein [Fibrobacter sp.]